MTHSDLIVAPQVRDLEALSRHLEGWMLRQMPQARDLRLENLAYPIGAGRSHETILFDAAWTEDGSPRSQGFVVRIKPTEHTVFPDDLFEQQYRVMKALHEQGRVKVAKVFWYETDPEILGAPFFVMEKKRGRVAVNSPPYAQSGWVKDATPEQRRKLWENGVRQLAAIPGTPLSTVQFLEGPPGARSGLEQEFDKYTRFVAWVRKAHDSDVLEETLGELRRRWPKNQPEGLVWGDARLGNMMFDENFEVVAVMDWEQPSLGGALHDLAWWAHMDRAFHGGMPGRPRLDGMGTREETVALWREVSGLPTDDFEWYEEFTGLKVAVLSIRMAVLKGQPIPDGAALARHIRGPSGR